MLNDVLCRGIINCAGDVPLCVWGNSRVTEAFSKLCVQRCLCGYFAELVGTGERRQFTKQFRNFSAQLGSLSLLATDGESIGKL